MSSLSFQLGTSRLLSPRDLRDFIPHPYIRFGKDLWLSAPPVKLMPQPDPHLPDPHQACLKFSISSLDGIHTSCLVIQILFQPSVVRLWCHYLVLKTLKCLPLLLLSYSHLGPSTSLPRMPLPLRSFCALEELFYKELVPVAPHWHPSQVRWLWAPAG